MYLKNKIFSAFLILILGTQLTKAQTTTIRGFVYEKETGEPAIFVNVYLKGTTLGVNTDINGYYSIVKVPKGSYILTATGIGFDTITQEVIVAEEDIITRKLYLPKKAVTLQSVEISAEREAQKTEVKMSVATLTPKDIKQIPTIGADPDLVQYLQVLPGVVFSGDQGGQLYIRGGTPIQNKVLLDGMTIYNPFHSIGLFSVFDTDIMKNADIYTGGFGGQFGGRISSVMDITTRDGNKKRFAGKVSTGTFQSKVLLEGPLAKQKEDGGGSASFIVSLKNSYLNQSSKVLYKHVNEDGLPYSFNDVYAKVNLNGANGSKVNFFGFNFTDKVNYTNQAKLNWESTGFGSNFILVPGSSATLLDGNFAYSKYKITQVEGDEKPRTSLVNGFNMGLGWTYFIGKNDINYGFEISGLKPITHFITMLIRKFLPLKTLQSLVYFLSTSLL
ncbi:MAG: TonB-dependent receptor [Bacteroidetes bacterium]|nr:TonB-dependent receptor [Bacteroidota bacterium]